MRQCKNRPKGKNSTGEMGKIKLEHKRRHDYGEPEHWTTMFDFQVHDATRRFEQGLALHSEQDGRQH